MNDSHATFRESYLLIVPQAFFFAEKDTAAQIEQDA